jgi:transcriptional regulator
MYRPKAFREEDRAELVPFMRAHSFAVLVAVHEGCPVAVHAPVVIDERGGVVVVRGHVAKANPIWHAFDGNEVLAIFGGPHAYVSPSAYEQRESVPTWNYMAVHAYGVPRALHIGDSEDKVRALLDEQIAAYEAAYAEQWDALPDKFRDGLMQGIVGFEMSVTRLEGQFKLSQNRSATDQHAVASMLMQDTDAAAVAVGEAMRRNLDSA